MGHPEGLTVETRRCFCGGKKQKLSSIKFINNSKAGKQSARLYTEGAERIFLRTYYQKKRRQFTEDSLHTTIYSRVKCMVQ
jgi:hypothetical protein